MTPRGHAEVAWEILDAIPAWRSLSPSDALASAQVHATLAVAGQIEAFGDTLTLAARLLSVEHPPVPEQATTPGQAAWIEASAHLYAGWQPGTWPMFDPLDPRGFRWASPLEGD